MLYSRFQVLVQHEPDLDNVLAKLFGSAERVPSGLVRAAIDSCGVEWGYEGVRGLVDATKPKACAFLVSVLVLFLPARAVVVA